MRRLEGLKMTSVLRTRGDKAPLLSDFFKDLHIANEQPEERRYDAMEYAFNDIMTMMCREFLGSMDSVSSTSKMFVRQVRDFRQLIGKFPLFTTGEGVEVPVIPKNSYESLISVLAMQDKMDEESIGKSTARIIDGKKVEMDPHGMMRKAGYDIDEGLGLDLMETLEDLGLLEVVEAKHVPKEVIESDVYLGTTPKAQPKSILLDYSGTYKPNMTIGGLF